MYATYSFRWAGSICPSLILHGRTEIKARALVLGEVSALSFCLGQSYQHSGFTFRKSFCLFFSIDWGSKQNENSRVKKLTPTGEPKQLGYAEGVC